MKTDINEGSVSISLAELHDFGHLDLGAPGYYSPSMKRLKELGVPMAGEKELKLDPAYSHHRQESTDTLAIEFSWSQP